MDARPLIAALAAAGTLALAACGTTTTVTQTVTVTKSAAAAPDAHARTEPASSEEAAPTPSGASSAYKRCDANIRAKRVTTTCGFAENTFYAYFIGSGATTLRVYSPATGRTFTTHCSGGATVVCRTSDGGVVKFPRRAIDAYSEDQASAYAASHETGDTGVPDPGAAPTPSDDDGGSSNAYSSPGTTDDDSGDPSFCDTHNCIPNYPNGNGTTVQCADGTYSHSGGIRGACSHHGGVG